MSRPLAYDPQEGYRWQILTRGPVDRAWEHCDYATDTRDLHHLLGEYRLAYGPGWSFRAISLPRRFWPQRTVPATVRWG